MEMLNLANPEHLLNQRSCDRTLFARTFQQNGNTKIMVFVGGRCSIILSALPN